MWLLTVFLLQQCVKLLKHNKNDNDLDEVDKISTLGGDNDETPNRDIVMVIRRTESDHE